MERALNVGGARSCNSPRSQPISNCALWNACLRKMMAQQLRLRLGRAVLTRFENLGDLRMQLLPAPPEEHSVRGILHERMLEDIFRVGGETAGKHKAGFCQTVECRLQIGVRVIADSGQELVSKLPADHSTDLGDFLGRADIVEARQKRGMQRRWHANG